MESESFNYLSVLLAIVLGLAITQVLQGLRGLILTRAKVKLYLPTLIWAGLVLLIAIQGWWASFGMRMRAHWTFVALLVIVLQAISVYMAAALVLPDVTGDAIVDLRDHYLAHKSWFFGALLAATVFSAAKDLALEGHLPDRLNLAFHAIFGVSAITGAITRREWFHKLMALALLYCFSSTSPCCSHGSSLRHSCPVALQCSLQFAETPTRRYADTASFVVAATPRCVLWSTVFSKTVCYVAGASDVDCAVRASKDVDKDAPA
jgi:hypothetical protein